MALQLKQCWLITSYVLWHSPEGNFMGYAEYIFLRYALEQLFWVILTCIHVNQLKLKLESYVCYKYKKHCGCTTFNADGDRNCSNLIIMQKKLYITCKRNHISFGVLLLHSRAMISFKWWILNVYRKKVWLSGWPIVFCHVINMLYKYHSFWRDSLFLSDDTILMPEPMLTLHV